MLNEVAVKLIEKERCSAYEGYANQLTDNMVCAGYEDGGRDACNGDSGGPLACKLVRHDSSKKKKKNKKGKKDKKSKSNSNDPEEAWVLYGITSWGAGCARARAPGVYVRVTKMVEWIESVISTTFDGLDSYKPDDWGLEVGPAFRATTPPRPALITRPKTSSIECGDTFEQTLGNFTSPGYPEHYPKNTYCEWNIEPADGMEYVRLNVTDMKFDARSSGCFVNDHIRVYDGQNEQVGTALCKIKKRSSWVVTARGGMKVILETDAVQSKKGFSANFELIKNEPSGCISDHVQQADQPGHFMTTGFPMKYPTNTECSWFVYSGTALPILVRLRLPSEHLINISCFTFLGSQPPDSASIFNL